MCLMCLTSALSRSKFKLDLAFLHDMHKSLVRYFFEQNHFCMFSCLVQQHERSSQRPPSGKCRPFSASSKTLNRPPPAPSRQSQQVSIVNLVTYYDLVCLYIHCCTCFYSIVHTLFSLITIFQGEIQVPFLWGQPAATELRYPARLIPNLGGVYTEFCQNTYVSMAVCSLTCTHLWNMGP